MDILFGLDTSLYWQIPLGLLLLVLSIFFIWLTFRIGRTLKSVEALLDENVFNLLKAIEELAVIHRDVSNVAGSLLRSVEKTVTALNQQLPQLLETTRRITASIQQISESEIRPTARNIQEITETVNQNVAKIDELVNTAKDFSETTIRHAEYYRDNLAGAITGIVSAWSALKASWNGFNRSWRSHTSDSQDTTPAEQDG